MKMTLVSEFEIPGEIVPQQRPRASVVGGHARVHDVPKCAEFRNMVRIIAGQTWSKAVDETSPFLVMVTFHLSIPKSATKKMRKAIADCDLLPCKKPDLDNAAKGVLDAITGVVWKDDSQVASLVCDKFYSDKPRTKVAIYKYIRHDSEDYTSVVGIK